MWKSIEEVESYFFNLCAFWQNTTNRGEFPLPRLPCVRLKYLGDLQPIIYEEYELSNFEGIHCSSENGGKDSLKQAKRAKKTKKAKRAVKICRIDEVNDMKFSHSIQFNAVPDWSCYYISYSNLKKIIYQLEKTIYTSNNDDSENTRLVPSEDPNKIFGKFLDIELEKISSFYDTQENEIFNEIEKLLKDEESLDLCLNQSDGQDMSTSYLRGLNRGGKPKASGFSWASRLRRESFISESIDEQTQDSDEDETDENTGFCKPKSDSEYRKLTFRNVINGRKESSATRRGLLDSNSQSGTHSSQANEDCFESETASGMNMTTTSLKRRIICLYVGLCELKSFVQLNRTGFFKVLKKYDKILGRSLKSEYIESHVNTASPFRFDALRNIDENIEKIEQVYAKVFTNYDMALARRELRLNVREHVIWQRNTVWREMIGIERKSQAAHFVLRRTILESENDPTLTRLQGDDELGLGLKKELTTPFGKISIPKCLSYSVLHNILIILIVFVLLLCIPMDLAEEQQNCLAMLVFVSLLWATEAIPLFVTSLIIPFLSVILRVVRSDEVPHLRLEPPEATKYIIASMWTPVIMLLLGGFTIAAALSKYNIARKIATFVLCKAGNSPKIVLIVSMFVASFASMWISNVAAPVLCYSIVQPFLRNLDPDSPMSKALILGVALASNIGGMLSPIASPQNIVALQIMQPPPSWGIWFFITLPVGIISNIFIWIILLISFRPGKGTTIVPIRPMKDKFTGIQWFISIVTFFTILLWCISHQLDWLLGDMGVIAIIPMILFFGTGILTKEDFNNFLWTIIILAAGGLSLGKSVESSGLLHVFAGNITASIKEFSLFSIFTIFAILILVIATFISHTVAALIILPLLQGVGANMEEPHPNLLVMGGALMCSAAMGLPTSGFPNMSELRILYSCQGIMKFIGVNELTNVAAIMMENSQTGKLYLNVNHFITRGVPSSIITLLVILSIGYFLMYIVGM